MWLLLFTLSVVPPPTVAGVQTLFVKVGPNPKVPGRSAGQSRAVVLIHGLALYPLSKERILTARLRTWQQPESLLVKSLSKDSDVYSLAYAQTSSVEAISQSQVILNYLSNLRTQGYQQIVLIGHSAGGLIARQLVEDHPQLGVTRVIQVCAPNIGSSLANLKAVRPAQTAFLNSLTRTDRLKVLELRSDRRIPEEVDFACVVGSGRLGGDGVVVARSQWSADLQNQGIPAFPVRVLHWEAMKNPNSIELISRLVREPLPRWHPTRVAEARKQLLGS
jgi:pimeloyl-ACP methyl ester carboxylesterase